MGMEYSGTGAVITPPPLIARQSVITDGRLAQLRPLAPALPPRFSVGQNHNNRSNAGIDFDQSAALRSRSIWIAPFPRGTLMPGGVRPCCPSSRLSPLLLPLSSPRLIEAMQLIPVPSVTSTATEYMFLTV